MEIDGIIYEKPSITAEEMRQTNQEERGKLAALKPETHVKVLIVEIDKAVAWEKEHSPLSQCATITRRWDKKTYSDELTRKIQEIVATIYKDSGFDVEFNTKTENFLRIVVSWNKSEQKLE